MRTGKIFKCITAATFIILLNLSSHALAISFPDALSRAEKGDYNAQSYLGHIYRCGKGVDRNPELARYWYKQVLKQPGADAKIKAHSSLILGFLYKSGKGGVQCYQTALKYFLNAAAQGYTDAHVNIGLLYAKGLGVEQDYEQALYWWNLAAQKDHPGANRYVAALKKTCDPAMKPANIIAAKAKTP